MLEKIEYIVNKYPDNIAYVVGDISITYKKLWDLSCEYALYLKKQGTSPVVIYGHKELNYFISIISCLISGRAYVPVGLCTPVYRINKIIESTGSTLVLTDRNIELDTFCCRVDELSIFDGESINKIDNDIVYIIFTSGSTGYPKGVPIYKDNLLNFVDWISNIETLSSYKNVNVLNQASFSFDLSVADMYYSLCNGHTLYALDVDIQEEYDKIFDLLNVIDVAVMTPTFMRLCLLNKDFNCSNFPLKCVYFCGELLDVSLVKKLFLSFPNLKIINAYGPTEATSAVCSILITSDMIDKYKILPVGDISCSATDIFVEDSEIVLKGRSVFHGYLSYGEGYYNDNGVNCFKTGDIGYIEDGLLFCCGRRDSLVKYKGYRIDLNDIESNLCLIDGVLQCAVVASYDNYVVKNIKAYVVVDGIDIDFIRKSLSKYLPSYMIPKVIKIVDKIPMNQNGKVDRKALL